MFNTVERITDTEIYYAAEDGKHCVMATDSRAEAIEKANYRRELGIIDGGEYFTYVIKAINHFYDCNGELTKNKIK